jgi:hypothetical protein
MLKINDTHSREGEQADERQQLVAPLHFRLV